MAAASGPSRRDPDSWDGVAASHLAAPIPYQAMGHPSPSTAALRVFLGPISLSRHGRPVIAFFRTVQGISSVIG